MSIATDAIEVARHTDDAAARVDRYMDSKVRLTAGEIIRPTNSAETGAAILADAYIFVGRFVSYPSEAAHVAHVLWIVHTHLMEVWDSTPRIAFLSPEPGSGKSRALEVTEPLVPRPVEAVNVTPSYLFRKVADEAGRPTILYDEIDTVFGPRAKENEEIRGLLNAGHRKGASAGRCVVRGKQIFTEELPAYCAVALAGLGGLPDTILSRCVVVRMRRRAPTEKIEPYRRRLNGPQGEVIRERLAAWAASISITLPALPPGIEDRDADIWESLIAVADAAGGNWPKQARDAALALVKESKQSTPSLGIALLADLRRVFGKAGADALPTEFILTALHALEDSPWADLRGKPLDARGLSYRVRQYGVGPKQLGAGDGNRKGYTREAFFDAWARYLPASPGRETSETNETNETSAASLVNVSDVSDVSDLPATQGVEI